MGQFDRRILPSDTAKQIKIWLCKSLREELYEAAEKLKNSRSRAWIGTYYREYVSYVRDQDKAEFDLILSETPNGYLHTIGNLGSKRTSVKRAEAILSSLIEFQEICLDECILDFLIYCDRLGWKIKFWDVDKFDLEATITKIERYLQKQQRELIARQNPTKSEVGLSIKRGRNGLNIEQCSAGKKSLIIDDFGDGLNLESPATLLSWQFRFAPFVGRKKELQSLKDWLNQDIDRNVQIICGEAGVGKTRLAFHFAEEIMEEGWQAGRDNGDFEGQWYTGTKGILFIVDYPEQQVDKVTELLSAIKKMEELKGKKVRVLLLSRNQGYLASSLNTVQGLRPTEAIHLSALEHKSESWEIFVNTWKELYALNVIDRGKLEQVTSNEVHSIFDSWLSQRVFHAHPLNILALSVYLYYEARTLEDGLNDLMMREIFRYFSEREHARIQSEIDAHNLRHNPDQAIDYRAVMALLAVSAIQGGFDRQNLFTFLESMKNENVGLILPSITELSQLSISFDDGISSITPDLYAADFFIYCIQKFAKEGFPIWVCNALGLANYGDSSKEKRIVSMRLFALQRLISDAKYKLNLTWNDELLVAYVCSQLKMANLICDFALLPALGYELRRVIYNALLIWVNHDLGENDSEVAYLTKADSFFRLGALESNIFQGVTGEEHLEDASNIYLDLIEHCYPSKGSDLSLCFTNIADILIRKKSSRCEPIENVDLLKHMINVVSDINEYYSKDKLDIFLQSNLFHKPSAVYCAYYGAFLSGHYSLANSDDQDYRIHDANQYLYYSSRLVFLKSILTPEFSNVETHQMVFIASLPLVYAMRQNLYELYLSEAAFDNIECCLIKDITLDLILAHEYEEMTLGEHEFLYEEHGIEKLTAAAEILTTKISCLFHEPQTIVDFLFALKKFARVSNNQDFLEDTLDIGIHVLRNWTFLNPHTFAPALIHHLLEYCWQIEYRRSYLLEVRELFANDVGRVVTQAFANLCKIYFMEIEKERHENLHLVDKNLIVDIKVILGLIE